MPFWGTSETTQLTFFSIRLKDISIFFYSFFIYYLFVSVYIVFTFYIALSIISLALNFEKKTGWVGAHVKIFEFKNRFYLICFNISPVTLDKLRIFTSVSIKPFIIFDYVYSIFINHFLLYIIIFITFLSTEIKWKIKTCGVCDLEAQTASTKRKRRKWR